MFKHERNSVTLGFLCLFKHGPLNPIGNERSMCEAIASLNFVLNTFMKVKSTASLNFVLNMFMMLKPIASLNFIPRRVHDA